MKTSPASGPPERVEDVHREEGAGRQEDDRYGTPQGRQRLRESPSTQLTRHQSGDDHDGRCGQRRDDVESDEVVPGNDVQQRRQHCDERREVDVPERQVTARGDVVELIPEVAVVAGHRQMQHQIDQRDEDRDRHRAAEQLLEPGLLARAVFRQRS